MKRLLVATTAMAAVVMVGSAMAADEASKQIQMLQYQLQQIQAQLESLKAKDAAMSEAISDETKAREKAEKEAREAALEAGGKLVFEGGKQKVIPPSNPKVVESGTHRFTLSSADNNWTIAPTGRIHFDMGTYLSQKPDSNTGPGSVAGGKLTGGVNVRRARVGVSGKAMGDFTYELILDAGGATDGAAGINAAKIAYTGIRNTIIEGGYMANFFVLEEASSSNDILFIERSTPSTLASGVAAGDPRAAVGFRTWESNWWFGAYLTGSAPGDTHQLTRRRLGAYERLTYNIVQSDLQTVHIGVGAEQLFDVPNTGVNTAHTITLSDRPELRIDPTSILSTGALGTLANPLTGVQVYSVETAATSGGFFYQGEYFHTVAKRRGKTDAKFDTGYAQISYTVGGRRSYSANCGCYGGVNPVTPFSPKGGGMGAFEFAARVSIADLRDQYDPTVIGNPGAAGANFNGVNGGKQTNYTLGLNWFWNSNMLWKFNYIHSDYDKLNPRTATVATPTAVGVKVDSLAARFQVMF